MRLTYRLDRNETPEQDRRDVVPSRDTSSVRSRCDDRRKGTEPHVQPQSGATCHHALDTKT